MKWLAAGSALGITMCWAGLAGAEPDETWDAVTGATAVTAVATSVLMPRIAYSNPEVTVGWKARWHVSVLAPVMTQVGLTLLNEYKLKDAFKDPRPGCPKELGGPG